MPNSTGRSTGRDDQRRLRPRDPRPRSGAGAHPVEHRAARPSPVHRVGPLAAAAVCLHDRSVAARWRRARARRRNRLRRGRGRPDRRSGRGASARGRGSGALRGRTRFAGQLHAAPGGCDLVAGPAALRGGLPRPLAGRGLADRPGRSAPHGRRAGPVVAVGPRARAGPAVVARPVDAAGWGRIRPRRRTWRPWSAIAPPKPLGGRRTLGNCSAAPAPRCRPTSCAWCRWPRCSRSTRRCRR